MDKEALERRLAAIFEEAEEAGIHLDGKPERVPVSRGDRLAESFEEISRFVDECGREPVKGLSMNERRLAARLEQIRQDPVRAAQLRPIDRHGLLPQPPAAMALAYRGAELNTSSVTSALSSRRSRSASSNG